MPSSILTLCLRTADRMDAASDRLGHGWSGHAPLAEASRQFRQSCEQLAANPGQQVITIAFVGPKNAGKSTLIRLLVSSEEKRQRIKTGDGFEAATTKPVWIGPRRPDLFAPESEQFIPSHESELVSLGFRYALLDVPGFNERNAVRQAAARGALDSAALKVLVVDRRSLESQESVHYLGHSDGATILPVINLIREEDENGDFEAFEERLRRKLPRSRLLPRIEVRDYLVAGDREAILAAAGQALGERLGEAAAGHSVETLVEPQLEEKLRRFEHRVTVLAGDHAEAQPHRVVRGLDGAGPFRAHDALRLPRFSRQRGAWLLVG